LWGLFFLDKGQQQMISPLIKWKRPFCPGDIPQKRHC